MKRILSAALAATSFAIRGLVFERSFDRLTSVILVSLLIVAAAEATGETLYVEVTPGHTVGPPSHAFEVCVLVSGTEYGGVNISLDWDDDYFADEVALNVGPTTGDVHYCFQNLAGPYETDSDYFVAVYRNGSGTNPDPIYQLFDVTILPVVIAEVHDAIDASCTGWSIVSESSSFGCDSGVIAGSYSGGGNRQGFASFSGGNLPSNMAADVCQKAVIDEAAAGDLTYTRPGFLFGGSIEDAAEGAVLVYLDDAYEDGNLTAETKYWTGSAVQASVSDVKCVSDDTITMTPGDVLVACVDGTWGSGAEVHAWTFPAPEYPEDDPCPGAGECQDADLGQPHAVLTESDCGGNVPGVTNGTAAGFYGLVREDASLVFDGDYAAWETEPPPAFTSLAVSPSALYPQMMVGETAPDAQTLSIGNDGNFGDIGGTVAVSGTPEDCQPTTGGNTTWLSPDDGSWTGVTPLADTSEEIDFSGAANCEHGAYEATLDVDCTGLPACDDAPTAVSVSLLVGASSDPGALGASFPLGTLIHDWDCDGPLGPCPAYTDSQGWDGLEHTQFGTDKEDLTATVSTFGVGLVGLGQPDDFLHGTSAPGDGSCPPDATIGEGDLAGFPTVDLANDGLGPLPIIEGCDWHEAFGTGVKVSTSLQADGVVFVNSFLREIDTKTAATNVFIFDSILDGHDQSLQGTIRGQYSPIVVAYSEVLGGSDVWKVSDGHVCYRSHLHAYTNLDYDPVDPPHYDIVQWMGQASDSQFIGCNVEGPFRDSQNAYRGSGPEPDSGDLTFAYNLFSGGRANTGNAVVAVGGKGEGPQSFTGDLVIYANQYLGANDSRGISWCRGAAFTVDELVPASQVYTSANTASDGSTSGTNGTLNPNSVCNTGPGSESWTAVTSVETGTPNTVLQTQIDAIDTQADQIDAWRAAVRQAAGLAAP